MSFVTNAISVYICSLFRSLLCGTVSNAFEKSSIIISTYNLLLSDGDKFVVMSMVLWASLCELLNVKETYNFLYIFYKRLLGIIKNLTETGYPCIYIDTYNYLFMCVCVCAYVLACVRACVRECVSACVRVRVCVCV